MYLGKLTISTKEKVIREVTFKKGLNLIVDETGSKKSTDSGNNVGKTTFLRVIDFCLGGKKDDIYTDKEFKRRNEKLYSFLVNQSVVFELTLISKTGTEYKIIRPIEGKPSVNGAECTTETAFAESLLALIFHSKGGRPTLAQLMNKFIRIEDYQISNALYFLHKMADKSEYEALFMFLFGFRETELLGAKRKLVDTVKRLGKVIDDSPYSLDDLEQQLHLINKEIGELEKTKASLNFKGDVDSELLTLKTLQTKISNLKESVSRLSLKVELNTSSLKQLRESKSKINVSAISNIYNQAKVELPNLQKKFEEVLQFHNQMIDNKAKYIQNILKTLEKQLAEGSHALNLLLDEESKVIGSMTKKGALDEYDKLNSKIQDKSRERGNREGLIQSLGSAAKEYADAERNLKALNDNIQKYESTFKDSLKEFNEYFSEFSHKLYGDKYYLISKRENNQTTDNYLLDIGNMNENIGTGKKKAQISALDLAYLKYSEKSNLTLPLFILHDQLETVFENQIDTLFEVSNSLSGQFVVAVLSDKLHKIDKDKVDKNCILRLSQSDKLFKLP